MWKHRVDSARANRIAPNPNVLVRTRACFSVRVSRDWVCMSERASCVCVMSEDRFLKEATYFES